jgi:hypothetical protein
MYTLKTPDFGGRCRGLIRIMWRQELASLEDVFGVLIGPYAAEAKHGKRTYFRRLLQAGHEFRNAHAECGGKHFQIADADFLPSILQVRDETSIHSHVLRHIDLCPLSSLAEST